MSRKTIIEAAKTQEANRSQDAGIDSLEYVRFQKRAGIEAWGAQWRCASPFGPQSQWSWLLDQREHLQNEINHGRKYLEQLQKDLIDCGALPEREAVGDGGLGASVRAARNGTNSLEGSMVEFLSGWLARLEERLGAVTRDIEGFPKYNNTESIGPEQSVLELLRAVG